MEDTVDPLEQHVDRLVRKIELDEAHTASREALLEVALLDRARVVVPEGVDSHDRAPARRERLGQVRGDEASAAGDQVAATGLEVAAVASVDGTSLILLLETPRRRERDDRIVVAQL